MNLTFLSLRMAQASVAALVLLATLPGPVAAQAAPTGDVLAKQKACLGCHMVDRKLVGPAFKDVAGKYAGQADGAATMIGSIRQGSKGKWGVMPMAPNAHVSDADAALLADWILSLRK